jgi:hypothetical protein
MPLAEFAIMHVQILTGSDLYANLVQWMSFLVLIFLGLLTAAELGLSGRQQLVSAVLIATLPMAILQASSTQNDLVVSAFVMAFGLFMLRMRRDLSGENILFAALSLGLALLTKGTAYLYCGAIGAVLALSMLLECRSDRVRFRKAMAALAFVVVVALALNAGHLARNYRSYGHPLSTETKRYQNADMSAVALLANIARNGMVHLGTPSLKANQYLYRATEVALGSQLNNPGTTWSGTSFDIPYSRHEDSAGNPIHMLIAMLSLLSLPILWWHGRHREALWYAMGTGLGAVLFCWVLRWQPWASRLHTPLFAMAAPLLAMTLAGEGGGVRYGVGYVVVLCMVIYGLVFALANQSRSLVSLDWFHKDRMGLYFTNREDLYHDYKNAIGAVQGEGPQEVGLYLGGDDWEYPLWALASHVQEGGGAVSFRHVGVGDSSGEVFDEESLPMFVIATQDLDSWKHAAEYRSVYASQHVSVFRKWKQSDCIPAVKTLRLSNAAIGATSTCACGNLWALSTSMLTPLTDHNWGGSSCTSIPNDGLLCGLLRGRTRNADAWILVAG